MPPKKLLDKKSAEQIDLKSNALLTMMVQQGLMSQGDAAETMGLISGEIIISSGSNPYFGKPLAEIEFAIKKGRQISKMGEAEDSVKKANSLIKQALLAHDFDEPIDRAIQCKIVCLFIRKSEAYESMLAFGSSPAMIKLMAKEMQSNRDFYTQDLLQWHVIRNLTKLTDFLAPEQIAVSMFVDNFEKDFEQFKLRPLSKRQVSQMIPTATKREQDSVYEVIKDARGLCVKYSETYIEHHKQLLKLCEKQGIDHESLMQRQTKLFDSIYGGLLQHPIVQQATPAQIIGVKQTVKEMLKLAHNYRASGETPQISFSSMHQSATSDLSIAELATLGTENATTSSAVVKPQATTTVEDPWDIVNFRKKYATAQSKKTIFVDLCEAVMADARSKVTSFLLSQTEAVAYLDEEYNGLTPLEHAAQHNCLKNVRLLLRHPIKNLENALTLSTDEAIKELIRAKMTAGKSQQDEPVIKTSSIVAVSHSSVSHMRYQLLIEEYTAKLKIFHEDIQHLTRLSEQHHDELSTTDDYQKFIAELAILQANYNEYDRINFPEWLSKIIKSDKGETLKESLSTLEKELSQNMRQLDIYLDKAKRLPAKIQCASKEVARLEPPKAAVKVVYSKPESKSSTPALEIIPSVDEYEPEPIYSDSISSSSSSSVPAVGEPTTTSSSATAAKPKLFSEATQFWQNERALQSATLTRFCEFKVTDPRDLVLKRIQLYAIIFKLMRYMEIQKNHNYLPFGRRDGITRQLGADTVRIMRNSLVHSLQLIGDSDEDVVKNLEAFKSLGKLLAQAMLTRKFEEVEKHPLFKRLYQHGKSLIINQDRMPDHEDQEYYLFQLSNYQLTINMYDGVLPAGMQASATQMIRIRIAKYCAAVTGHSEERQQALASTHITPPSNLKMDEDEVAEYIAAKLKSEWSDRSLGSSMSSSS